MSFQETFSASYFQVSALCRLAEKAALFVLRASGLKSMAVARRHTCNCEKHCFISLVCTGNEITMLREREANLFSRSESGCQHANCCFILKFVRVAWECAREHLHRSLPFMLTSDPNIWTHPLEITTLAPIQFICRPAKKLQSQSSPNFFCFPRGSGDCEFPPWLLKELQTDKKLCPKSARAVTKTGRCAKNSTRGENQSDAARECFES